MSVIKNRKIFIGIAAVFVGASIAAVLFFGLRPGMEFKGGSLWQIKTSASAEEIKSFFAETTKLENAVVYPEKETDSFIIRSEEITENDRVRIASEASVKLPEFSELRFESIGPAIGDELKVKAFWALGIALAMIALYVTFAFRKVSYPVKSWQYGLIVIITLLHDTIIPIGVFAALNAWRGTEIDINFLTAMLVIMGFSVNDTVVIFDRIRENLLKSGHRGKMSKSDLGEVIDGSVRQTAKRSIFTNVSVMIVLASLFILGPASFKNFILALFIGVFFGTYSSVFVASPLLYMVHRERK